MKKLFSILFILSFVWCTAYAQEVSIFDTAPDITVGADTIPPAGFLPPKWVFDYTAIPNVSGGTVGAIFFQGKFYFNRWNGENCYTFMADANGAPDPATLETILMPPYLGNIRDMAIAPDQSGTMFLWGGSAGSTLYKMDAGMNVIASYSIPGADFRAISWDPVTGGFWNGDFGGPVTCYDTTGALLGTSATGSALAAKYGGAFTTPATFPGVNSVWWWNQFSGSGELVQVDLATDATINSFVFTGGAIAGGAEAVVIGNENCILLNFQNVALAAYVLSIVPVELTSFTTSLNQNDVTLNWTTATELNNQGFEIQRSSNGQFERVGYVVGNGTTTEIRNYVFTETNVNEGIHFYRLKQIDHDGTFEYSPIVSVEVIAPLVFTLEQNYPNPFNPSTKITFNLAVDSKVSLKVFDVLGQEVADLISGDLTASSYEIDFNASNINSGVYFYRIDAAGIDGTNFTSVKKMILTK